MKYSDLLSTIALVISFVSLGISMINFLKDKYKLKVRASIAYGSEPFNIDVQVTNIGRRPISIVEVFYAEDASERDYPIRTPIYGGFIDKVPSISLAENEAKQFWSKDISLESLLKTTKKLEVGVIDSKGKLYKTCIDNAGYSVLDEDFE